ncbi:MAG: IPTL-CTERM sorting domain-containing protein, partial [Dehalococcoidia bacterium]
LDTTCAAAEEACCLPDGNCDLADPLCCADMGGVSQGAGTTCDEPGLCSPTIPAVSEWGVVVMVLLVLAAGIVVISKRRALRTAA